MLRNYSIPLEDIANSDTSNNARVLFQGAGTIKQIVIAASITSETDGVAIIELSKSGTRDVNISVTDGKLTALIAAAAVGFRITTTGATNPDVNVVIPCNVPISIGEAVYMHVGDMSAGTWTLRGICLLTVDMR